MIRLIFSLGLIAGIAPVANAAVPSTAEDFLTSCSAQAASYETHPCQWYLKGFIDGRGSSAAAVRTYCLPDEGFTIDQIRRVVLKWMNDHPEQLHLYLGRAITTALGNAFPCGKPK